MPLIKLYTQFNSVSKEVVDGTKKQKRAKHIPKKFHSIMWGRTM